MLNYKSLLILPCSRYLTKFFKSIFVERFLLKFSKSFAAIFLNWEKNLFFIEFSVLLSKIGIIKVFKIENIELGKLPKLDLDKEEPEKTEKPIIEISKLKMQIYNLTNELEKYKIKENEKDEFNIDDNEAHRLKI